MMAIAPRIHVCQMCHKRPASFSTDWRCSYCNELYSELVKKFNGVWQPAYDILIYFINSPSDNLVKIGVAKSPIVRLKKLESEKKKPLEFIGFMPGNLTIEAALDERFQAYRAYHRFWRCEWFHKSAEIMDYAARYTMTLEEARAEIQSSWERAVAIAISDVNPKWKRVFPLPKAADHYYAFAETYKI